MNSYDHFEILTTRSRENGFQEQKTCRIFKHLSETDIRRTDQIVGFAHLLPGLPGIAVTYKLYDTTKNVRFGHTIQKFNEVLVFNIPRDRLNSFKTNDFGDLLNVFSEVPKKFSGFPDIDTKLEIPELSHVNEAYIGIQELLDNTNFFTHEYQQFMDQDHFLTLDGFQRFLIVLIQQKILENDPKRYYFYFAKNFSSCHLMPRVTSGVERIETNSNTVISLEYGPNWTIGAYGYYRAPERLQQGPGLLSEVLERLHDGPERLQDDPDQFNEGPDQLQEGLELLQQAPKPMHDGPEQLQEGPGQGATPEQLHQGPDQLQESPKHLQKDPEPSQTKPELIRKAPEQLQEGPKNKKCKFS